jgi:hypothetical protein
MILPNGRIIRSVYSLVKPERDFGMKRPALSGTRCPHCGSYRTKIDWTNTNNYRMVLLGVIVAVAGTWPHGFERVCVDCRRKFAP